MTVRRVALGIILIFFSTSLLLLPSVASSSCPLSLAPIVVSAVKGQDIFIPIQPYVTSGAANLETLSIGYCPAASQSQLLSDGIFHFIPDPDTTGTYTMSYSLCDASSVCSNSTLTVVVEPTEQPLFASNDVVAPRAIFANSSNEFTIDVLANDGPAGLLGTIDELLIVTPPELGTAWFDYLSRRVWFRPAEGQFGAYSFRYQISNEQSSATAWVRLMLLPAAQLQLQGLLPDGSLVAPDRHIVVPANSTSWLPLDPFLLQAPTDENDLDPASLTIVVPPSLGSASLLPRGGKQGTGDLAQVGDLLFYYLPNLGEVGQDRIEYSVCNRRGQCALGDLYLTLALPEPPLLVPIVRTLIVGQQLLVPLSSTAAVDLDPSSITFLRLPSSGDLGVQVNPSTGDIQLLGASEGTYIFGVSACEAARNSAAAPACAQTSITVLVNANSPPTAADDGFFINFNQPQPRLSLDVLLNDADPDGNLNPLSLEIVSPPTSGAVAVVDTDALTVLYYPLIASGGIDTFFYRVCDQLLLCSVAQVTLYQAIASPPLARSVSVATFTDVPIEFAIDVTDPDQNIDLQSLQVSITDFSALGASVVVNQPRGSLTYFPPAGLPATDSPSIVDTFAYWICDATALCSQASVFVTISDSSLASTSLMVVANNDTATTRLGVPVTISWRSNDYDLSAVNHFPSSSSSSSPVQSSNPAPVAANATVIVVSPPAAAQGTLDFLANGVAVFYPADGFSGTAQAVYQFLGANGLASNTATITIRVLAPIASPLTAVNDEVVTLEALPFAIAVLGNDLGGPVNTMTIIAAPTMFGNEARVVALAERGQFHIVFTPDPAFLGDDSFEYEICNAIGCSSAQVSVTVLRMRPRLQSSPQVLLEDFPLTFDGPKLAYDPQNNIDYNSVVIIGKPSHGDVALLPGTLQFVYTPFSNFSGPDDFWYELCDTTRHCSKEQVQLFVLPKRPPTLEADLFYTYTGVPIVLDVLSNDVDPQLNPDSLSLALLPASGSLTVQASQPTKTLYFAPLVGFTGTLEASYMVCSALYPTLCSEARIVIVVLPNDYAPVALDDHASVAVGSSVHIPVLDNDRDLDGNLDPTSVVIVQQPAAGTVSVNPVDGSLTYTAPTTVPTNNINGNNVVSLVYQVCDKAVPSRCDQASVSVNVVPNSSPPITSKLNVVTTVSVPTSFDPLSLVHDPDDNLDPSTFKLLASPTAGSLDCQMSTDAEAAVTCRYVPTNTPTQGGVPIVVPYQVCDQSGLCTVGELSFTVEPAFAPVVQDDVTVTAQNVPVSVSVLANDFDQIGFDPTSLVIVSSPGNSTGTAVVVPASPSSSSSNGQPTILFTPAVDFLGTASFSYQICDVLVPPFCATATVQVTVGADHPPVAVDDEYTVLQGSTTVLRIGQNDYDPEGNLDPRTCLTVSQPTAGSFQTQPFFSDGLQVSYTAPAHFVGTATANYSLCDTAGACAHASVLIHVLYDHPPVANNDVFTLLAGTSSTGRFEPLANDVDLDGDLDFASFQIVSAVRSTTSIAYDPVTGVLSYSSPLDGGSELLTYRVCDLVNQCAQANITVQLVTDSPPVAVADVAEVQEGQRVVIDVLHNDFDVDGNLNPSSVSCDSTPLYGSCVASPDGFVTYVAMPGVSNRFDSFSYTVCDDLGLCVNGTVTVSIYDPLPSPVAVDDLVQTTIGTPVVFDPLANDLDTDNATVLVVVDGPLNGTLVYDPLTHRCTFVPDQGFVGTSTFVYKLCPPNDLVNACSSATVNVTVAANHAPSAQPDLVLAVPGQPVTINVLANDVDPDHNLNPASVVILSPPAQGAVLSIDPSTGSVFYLPPSTGAPTYDNFTYQVCDFSRVCSSATVFVHVVANRPPLAGDDYAATLAGVPIVISLAANDFDPDDNLDLSSIVVTTPSTAGGWIYVVPGNSGSVVYTPGSDNTASTDSFGYTIYDSGSPRLSASAKVFVEITANSPPVAVDDVYQIAYGTGQQSFAVVDNDYDPDDNLDPSAVVITSGPSLGVATVIVQGSPPTASVVYQPSLGAQGLDHFSYSVSDRLGLSAVALVSINIVQSQPPIAANDWATTFTNLPVSVDILHNDFSQSGFALPTIASLPSGGTVTIVGSSAADARAVYTPNAGFAGLDSFSYRVCSQNSSACDEAIVSVYVAATSSAPNAHNDTATVTVGSRVSIPVLDNDVDSDGNLDPSTLTLLTPSLPPFVTVYVDPTTHQLVCLVGNGTITPQNSDVVVEYQVCDSTQHCSVASVTIKLVANSLPTTRNDQYVIAAIPGLTQLLLVTSNDEDPDGGLDFSSLQVTTLPASGTISGINLNDGSVLYRVSDSVSPSTVSTDQFNYRICDFFSQCAFAKVTITLVPNRAPVAVDDTATCLRNRQVIVDVLSNDYDLDGNLDPFSITIVSPPSSGTAIIQRQADREVVLFVSAEGFTGLESFQYTISDDLAVSNVATVKVTVPVPFGPNAVADFAVTTTGHSVAISVLANDQPSQEAPINFSSLQLVSAVSQQGGTLSVLLGGQILYTPPNSSGVSSDLFSYTICDTLEACATTTVNVSVLDPSLTSPPVALNDFVQASPTIPITVDALANDYDVDGDLVPGSLELLFGPAFGSVDVASDIASPAYFVYTSLPGFSNVVDHFTYHVCDSVPAHACATATVTVAILARTQPPTAVADQVTVTGGRSVPIDVLANDFDPDGDLVASSLTIVSNSAGGIASVDPQTHQIVFAAQLGFTGLASIQYRICDSTNSCAVGNVVVVVTDPFPTGANPDDFEIAANTLLTANVFANDQLADFVSSQVVSQPLNGQLVSFDLNTGEFIYLPNDHFVGFDSFQYELCTTFACTTVPVSIMVYPTQFAPVARDDNVNITLNSGPVVIPVFQNDNAIGSNHLVLSSSTIISQPANGVVSLSSLPDGITYTANSGFVGTDQFLYQIVDQLGSTASATVYIVVQEPPSSFKPSDYHLSTSNLLPVSQYLLLDNLAPILTPDQVVLSIISAPLASEGTVVLDQGSGVAQFIPNPSFSGLAQYTYQACYQQVCGVATVEIEVSAFACPS